MRITEASFKRRFSVNYYKNLILPMGEMSFYKNWPEAGRRGDPYPVIAKRGEVSERVGGGKYELSLGDGAVRRLVGAYFPWANYDVSFDSLCGSVGFSVLGGEGAVEICLTKDGNLSVFLNGEEQKFKAPAVSCGKLSVWFRGEGVTVYLTADGEETCLCDLAHPTLMRYCRVEALESAKVVLAVSGSGKTVISDLKWYLTAGISQADLRPIKYEDGTPIVEGGRVFLTASARCAVGKYQVVLSWCHTTADFRLEGGIFFEYSDGYLCGDVASSVIYDRRTGEWKINMCSFSHGHVVGHGNSLSDPRFGINTVEIELMPEAPEAPEAPETEEASKGEASELANAELAENPNAKAECTESTDDDARARFFAYERDEDPDSIYYNGRWYMAICRSTDEGYRYYHFVSEDDGESYRFLARTDGAEKTGGSYVKCDDGVYFVCGSDYKKRSVYAV